MKWRSTLNGRNISLAVLFLVVVLSLGSGCNTGKGGGQPPATGREATLSRAAYGCHRLELHLVNANRTAISISKKSVACRHGYFKRATPTMTDVQTVLMEQSTSYGPDCRTTLSANGQTYVIHTQQNYCYWEAGDITASVISGNAVIYDRQSGSFSGGKPGIVSVRLY